jgi:putative acetyltransferase
VSAIRPARAVDAVAMATLYRRSVEGLGARDYSTEQVRAWAGQGPDAGRFQAKLSDGRRCWIAESDAGTMQGFVDLEADGHVAFLYVDPDAAGQGVARRLLGRVEAEARAARMSHLHVEASETARPVFERRGWTVVARHDFKVAGVPIHNWAMELRL